VDLLQGDIKVMIFATAITALQTWTGSRIKGLNDQVAAFHDLHRKIEREIETGIPLSDDYVRDAESTLRGVMAGMVPVSNRVFDKARAEVTKELDAELQRLGITQPKASK
jgi:hypothetical protein